MKIIDFRARPNTEQYMRLYEGTYAWDNFFNFPKPETTTLDKFIDSLKMAGVTQAVFTGRNSPRVSLSNDYVFECVQAYPDRLIGFAGIDPTQGLNSLREIERTISKMGFKGISLDPHHIKIFPDDRILYPIYYKCLEIDIPVIFTMGPLVGKWGAPFAVDNLAEDLPDLKIICSHGVWPQVNEFIALAFRHKNVYLEASIYQFLPGAEPIFDAANTILQDKIVYASAFPFRPLVDVKRFLEYPFEKNVVDKLVYKNAARILKISEN